MRLEIYHHFLILNADLLIFASSTLRKYRDIFFPNPHIFLHDSNKKNWQHFTLGSTNTLRILVGILSLSMFNLYSNQSINHHQQIHVFLYSIWPEGSYCCNLLDFWLKSYFYVKWRILDRNTRCKIYLKTYISLSNNSTTTKAE